MRSKTCNDSQRENEKIQGQECAREAAKNQLSKLTPTQQKKVIEERRWKDVMRQRKCRQTKRMKIETQEEIAVTPTKVYSSRQEAGEALQRLRVKLPFSPRKRKALALKLAVEEGNIPAFFHIPSQRSKDDGAVQTKVVEFLERDDISWAAPSMRDASIVRIKNIGNLGKQKIVVQTRYLTMTVMEAYSIFKDEMSMQLGVQ